MTWLWILDVKSLDDDCSFLYCTSVWSSPDSSRRGVWNEFTIQAKSITDEEILKWISGQQRYLDTQSMWITQSSTKSLCCQRVSRRSSFLLHFKWSPWLTPGYTWCTSSSASSLSTWKLFSLATQYHLSSVLALCHFLT